MKTTTKLIAALLFTAAISLTNQAKAQMSPSSSSLKFGIGAETGVATGTVSNIGGWYYGGTARLQYSASSKIAFTLTSGYYNFQAFSSTYPTTSFGGYQYLVNAHNLGVIPVKVGIKHFCSNGLYFMAEGGVGFETSYNLDKKLILSPSVGWSGDKLDVSARYENFSMQNSNYGLIGVRLAYAFSL